MEITPRGFVVFLLGLILFIKGPKCLSWGIMVSVPFFRTNVISHPMISSLIGPSFYFVGLLVLKKILNMVITKDLWFMSGKKNLFLPLLRKDSLCPSSLSHLELRSLLWNFFVQFNNLCLEEDERHVLRFSW